MYVLVNITLEDYRYFETKRLVSNRTPIQNIVKTFIPTRRKLCTNQSSLDCVTLVRLVAADSRHLVKRATQTVDRGM